MACKVKVVEASTHESGLFPPLFSVELRYWRAIHAELMTHRVFSRNAGSSRATPVKKMLSQVWNDPAGPIHWGTNQAGMQAKSELQGWRRWLVKLIWRLSAKNQCFYAWLMMKIGLHKQVTNRLLEPFQFISVLVSSTEWDNFFELRCHPDAQPEFQELAEEIQIAILGTDPKKLKVGEWHLPYVLDSERNIYSIKTLLQLSTARCARVSYAPFDGNPAVEKEKQRHDDLVGSVPRHSSPTEHQASCNGSNAFVKNFRGFTQYRWHIES